MFIVSFILFTVVVLVSYLCHFRLLLFYRSLIIMFLYLFFDALSETLLHVCHSDVEYEEFLDSDCYRFYEDSIGSDLVCYRVRDSVLFKFLKGLN